MLTKRTLNTIMLLLEQGNLYDPAEDGVLIGQGERSYLQSRLTQSGLLNEAGLLTKPLESISLFEVLVSLDETLYLKEDKESGNPANNDNVRGENKDSDTPIPHSIKALSKSFCLWLKSIKLNEL